MFSYTPGVMDIKRSIYRGVVLRTINGYFDL
jgi:hypothetical protein